MTKSFEAMLTRLGNILGFTALSVTILGSGIGALDAAAQAPKSVAAEDNQTEVVAPVTSLGELIDRLDAVDRYTASAAYSVLLPLAPDDIIYNVEIQSAKADGDRLSPCNYLIEWTLPTPSGESLGFAAYADGNHFRYRDERIREYHFDWDSIPFLTRDGGVQRNAQFVELTPQILAAQLREIADNPTFEYTFQPDLTSGGRKVARLNANEVINGYTARKLSYTFDPATALPIAIEIESNPGEISEQSVNVSFAPATAQPVDDFSEEMLIDRYPTIFERYRQSNFRAENLPGTMLVSFAMPQLAGDRFVYNRGDGFSAPTIIAVLDPTVDTTAETIADVRKSVATLPYNVEIIWAFLSNNADTIEPLVGNAQPGERSLLNARALARDSGITSFPTLLFVNSDGSIANVQTGYNKNLPTIVMESTALMN